MMLLDLEKDQMLYDKRKPCKVTLPVFSRRKAETIELGFHGGSEQIVCPMTSNLAQLLRRKIEFSTEISRK